MFAWRKAPAFILVSGDAGALLVPPQGRELYAAPRDDAARQAILQRLAQQPNARVIVLANGAAQEFRHEILPPLHAVDRYKLVRQRLRQAFPQAYAAASRMIDRRQVLLGGLQQGGVVAAWLGDLPPAHTTLGLLPVEAAGLVQRLVPQAETGWAMLLAHFGTGGLRQLVIHDGQLVFTRQTQLPLLSVDAVLRVIEDARGYLARFGLKESADLRVAILLDPDSLAALRQDMRLRRMMLLTPRQAGEQLGLSLLPDADAGDSDLVFAGWVARQPRLVLPLVPPAMQRQRHEARMAAWGLRAAAAMLLLALVVTGQDVVRWAWQAYANHRAAADVAAMRENLRAEEAALAPTAKPLGRLRAALERQRLFNEAPTAPWHVLRQMGQALAGKARVMSLEWRGNDSLAVTLRLDPAASNASADRETIIRNFRSLVDALGQGMSGYRIEVTRYPFPAMPQEILTNVGGVTDDVADAPTATLMLRRVP